MEKNKDVSWLGISILLSIILTIALNIGLRMFPNAGRRMGERIEEMATREPDPDQPRVRVFFPWKAMLIGSLVLTIVLNLVLVLFR
jgi:hypothetical protein